MEAEKRKATPERVAAGLESTSASKLTVNGGGTNIRKILTYTESRVLNFLNRGGRHSVADISIGTHLSDPRSVIRNLRAKGVPVLDEWHNCTNSHGRYKKYFIGKEVGNE